MSEASQIMAAIDSSEGARAEHLLALLYDELRRLASAKLARESNTQTLQATALVHEAWLRVTAGEEKRWHNRAHFFAAAAEAMRRILIDKARRKRAVRHGGSHERAELDELEIAAPAREEELLAVNEALDSLAAMDSLAAIDRQKAEIVKLKYFVGLTAEQIAALMELSEPTIKRHLAYARPWLYREINRS